MILIMQTLSSLAALDYLSAFSGNGRKIFVFGDRQNLVQPPTSSIKGWRKMFRVKPR